MTDTTTTPGAAAVPVPLPVLHDAATRTDLEDWGPLEEATGPEMSTSGVTLWQDDDGSETGIWECAAGPSHWTLETNEFVHVLSGSMTVTADGGEPVELGAGDTILFPLGWSGTWEIHERLRKLYVIF
jgi:uncharacterized cupin superfamily protein